MLDLFHFDATLSIEEVANDLEYWYLKFQGQMHFQVEMHIKHAYSTYETLSNDIWAMTL